MGKLDEADYFMIGGSIVLIVMMIGAIVISLAEKDVEKEAIKAGLVQEVKEGRVIWVKQ